MRIPLGRKIPPALGIPIAVAIGLSLGWLGRPYWQAVPFVCLKLAGRGPDCPWDRTFRFGSDMQLLAGLLQSLSPKVRLVAQDSARGLECYETGSRPFWVKKEEGKNGGGRGLSALIAEHAWMSSMNPGQGVRAGDSVLDCGAHIGVFTALALSRGAAKVIAIEPAPDNLFCLKKNFAAEIAAGQVVVVEKGVWNSAGFLDLRLSDITPAEDSFIEPVGGRVLRVPITTIDLLVAELGLPTVDYIKMDIEGAEREAIQGGLETIRRAHPRIMLAMYHLPDDRDVLPAVVRSADPAYRQVCGPCELDPTDPRKLIPHVSYFF